MLNIKWSGAVAALAVAFGSGIVLTYETARAQAGGQPQRKPFFQNQKQNQNQNQQRMLQRRGYASGIAITSDVQYVFVAEGGFVYKLNKSDLSLAAHGALRPARVGGPQGQQGQILAPAQQPPPPPMPEEEPTAPAESPAPPEGG